MDIHLPQNVDANRYGKLYVVATPIGNLDDFSVRAQTTLKDVSLIACEDTRHCQALLKHYTIDTPCVSLHQFNESKQGAKLIEKLTSGQNLALVSDAGTPLVSDPGALLVQLACQHGISVLPVPGACAAVSALSVLPIGEGPFVFEGFLPAQSQGRKNRLQSLALDTRRCIFYEAPHRILKCVEDMIAVFGGNRKAGIAREMTKLYESYYWGTLDELLEKLKTEAIPHKGEFVVIVEGAQITISQDSQLQEKTLSLLLPHMSVKEAAKITAQITGFSKNDCYEKALELKK